MEHRYPKLWNDATEDRLRESIRQRLSADEQLSTLPQKIQFCTRCVVSNQRPRITFDEEGVCSACRYSDRKRDGIDWEARDRELRTLLDKYRRSEGYDVIVPGSGGKDSSMVAHRLKHDYGMHPLTVTWAPFAYTEIGFQNFFNFIQSGFDNLTAWPNGILHRKLSRLCLELLGDAWQPFAFGQLNYAMQIATKFGINLVFFGENGEAEYGGSTKANDRPCFNWNDWDEVYLKGAAVDRIIELGNDLGVISQDERREISDFYRLPPKETLKSNDIQFHWYSYYRRWIPQENYYYTRENTAFEANPDGRSEGTYSKYASLDDRMDGFHFYFAFLKFGIGRATSDAAHEIRDGHITREEGQSLVRRYDGEFPKNHFHEFLDYLNISEDYFWEIADRYRSPHVWDKTAEGKWILRRAVWSETTGVEPCSPTLQPSPVE